MKLDKVPHVTRNSQVGHPSAIVTSSQLYSVSAQNENELVFECILTCYDKLQPLLLKCSKFE